MDPLTSSLLLGAIVLILFFLIRNYTYWQRHGIPTPKGFVPIFGHVLPAITGKENMSEIVRDIYNNTKDASMVGFYKIAEPVLLIREPGLVKTVMQTNFTSFHENAAKVNPDVDPLLAKNPFFTYGDVWVTGRKRLTYAFSSMRLKILFETVKLVCKKFEDFVERRLKSGDKYEVELKYLFSKFTGEVVAGAGLGIEGHCFEDTPHPGAFDEIGKSFLEPNWINAISLSLVFFLSSLNKVLRIRFIPKKVDAFFRNIVKDVMESRRTETNPRNDFFQLMIELEKNEAEKIDQEIITAHALSFFVDGYETSSITLSFIGYQLAVNLDIQNKLREEIMTVKAKHNGELTYDALKEMTYMDQVISESQRYYPALGVLFKSCTQEFELEGSDGLRFRIKPGTNLMVSVHGMQMDPKYWTDPEVFDPDRFSNDRKQDIEKFTFIPFGEGPRICVGMRMALLQMKACLATLLTKYRLELSPKTQVPLKFVANHFLSAPVGGLWVNLKRV